MIPVKFTDVVAIVIMNDHTFVQRHESVMREKDGKSYRIKAIPVHGIKYNVDFDKAFVLHGWVPWVRYNWWHPWSIIQEWLWKTNHRAALLIYKESQPEPITTFADSDSKGGLTPRAFEGFIESRIPANYYRKWTKGTTTSRWLIWGLVAIVLLFIIMFAMGKL